MCMCVCVCVFQEVVKAIQYFCVFMSVKAKYVRRQYVHKHTHRHTHKHAPTHAHTHAMSCVSQCVLLCGPPPWQQAGGICLQPVQAHTHQRPYHQLHLDDGWAWLGVSAGKLDSQPFKTIPGVCVCVSWQVRLCCTDCV